MKKVINAVAEYNILAAQVTPRCWDYIKAHHRKVYNKMRAEIEKRGIRRLMFGFNKMMKPVCMYITYKVG